MKPSDLYNPMVKFVLRSPLHPLMSGSTMLLTFAGRKSGKQYTTPISYAREGNVITLITNRKHGWWKNLEAAAPVKVRVRGRELCGAAQVVPADAPALIAAMQKVYRGIPQAQAAQLAHDVVMIKIELN
jgi:deazaflavin-dependent oxidoreductase (nitroreductase family)